MLSAPLIGAFCAFVCAFPLHVQRSCNTGPCLPGGPYIGDAIYAGAARIGTYLDDTDPNRCQQAGQDVSAGQWPLVVVGQAAGPAGRQAPCTAGLNALEWYPWIGGREAWGPPPPARAYILPWHFAFSGPAPTAAQRRLELAQAERHHPRLILWYYAN